MQRLASAPVNACVILACSRAFGLVALFQFPKPWLWHEAPLAPDFST
jgi:hypothetical protein